MNNCRQCGKPVRLGAMRVSVMRKRGILHYIEHRDGTAMHEKGWECCTLKPYPKHEADTPRRQMCDRWNAENPLAKGGA